jgi:DNA-binding MarR family transcriptional regulator/GNAT superfamily N-acetyltransferase
MPSEDLAVGQVRSFNRTVAQRVGAMSDRFLARDRPMAEARVLWEIGPEGCEVRELRSRLGLDSGHASRLLRALEADGLARTAGSSADGRVRRAELTPAGLAERAVLDERSDALARSFLGPLGPRQRDRLVAAMADVQRLLTAGTVELVARDPAHPDADACLRAYFAELDERFTQGFVPGEDGSAEPDALRAPAGLFLVAYRGPEPVGCGGVKHHDDGWAEIKRMWVAPSARGLGLGRRLLSELEACARGRGARVARLDTNDVLSEAIGLYRSSGYAEVPSFGGSPFADHWFERALGPP